MRQAKSKANESSQALEAFAIYRDMGVGRTTQATAKDLSKSHGLIKGWCTLHAWVRRCRSHDLEVDRRRKIGDLRAIEEMRIRHTKRALLIQEIADLELAKMKKAAAKKKAKRTTIDDKTVLKMSEDGAKLERLSRGEPSEITEQHGSEGLDLSGLTLDELKQLRALRSKVRARQVAEEEAKGGADVD